MSEPDLVNLLHRYIYIGLELVGAVTTLTILGEVLCRHLQLKRFALKLAWLIIELNKPELPQRKPDVRSKLSR